jgi:hypothetical protein
MAEEAGFPIDSADPSSCIWRRHRNLLRFALTLSRRQQQPRDLLQHASKQPARQVALRWQQTVAEQSTKGRQTTSAVPIASKPASISPFGRIY